MKRQGRGCGGGVAAAVPGGARWRWWSAPAGAAWPEPASSRRPRSLGPAGRRGAPPSRPAPPWSGPADASRRGHRRRGPPSPRPGRPGRLRGRRVDAGLPAVPPLPGRRSVRARRSGPTPATIAATRAWLTSSGLQLGPTVARRLLIPVTGYGGPDGAGPRVSLVAARLPDGRVARFDSAAARRPRRRWRRRSGVIGLQHGGHAPTRRLVTAPRGGSSAPGGGPAARARRPCPARTGARAQARRQHRRATPPTSWPPPTGSTPSTASGLDGTGRDHRDLRARAVHAGRHHRLQGVLRVTTSVTNVPRRRRRAPAAERRGGPGHRGCHRAGPGGAIKVYTGPAAGTGPIDTYTAMVNDPSLKVITTSWGLCEPQMAIRGQQAAESALFAQAAAQGQTVVAASGDSGSTDCYTRRSQSTTADRGRPGRPARCDRGGRYLAHVGGIASRRVGVERLLRRRRRRGLVGLRPALLAVGPGRGRRRRRGPVRRPRPIQLPGGARRGGVGRPGPRLRHLLVLPRWHLGRRWVAPAAPRPCGRRWSPSSTRARRQPGRIDQSGAVRRRVVRRPPFNDVTTGTNALLSSSDGQIPGHRQLRPGHRMGFAGGIPAPGRADLTPRVPGGDRGPSPAKGPVTGGNSVTVTGYNFSGATSVQFGGTPASFSRDLAHVRCWPGPRPGRRPGPPWTSRSPTRRDRAPWWPPTTTPTPRRATGWWPATAASSPSVTPASRAPPAA